MLPLPEKFVERVLSDLGDAEGRALCAALDTVPVVSVRLNPAKGADVPEGGERVPWSRGGYYLRERPQFTLDPAFHTGAYYVQEAGSQFVEYLLAGQEMQGRRVLDLCAAPGGKTTLYASLVGREGLVVANEIDHRRAQVLADNVRKWGMGNVAVTVCEPKQLADFEGWFDVVAVDAPCSGEGMFRKDEAARTEWSEGNVRVCAVRQAEILRQAWRALRTGGTLLYSTCTFNRAEDEEVLAAFAEELGDELIAAPAVEVDPAWGVVCGEVGPFQTFRFYPHKTRGEGFFAAVACKSPLTGGRMRTPKARRAVFANISRSDERELTRWVENPASMYFLRVGDTCYAYPRAQVEAVRSLSEVVPVICSGVEMGQIFKGKLKPEFALALYAGLNREAVSVAELDDEQALRYLRKQDAEVGAFDEGMNLVTTHGRALGFAKRIGNRVNNLYPNTLKIIKN